MKKLLQNKNLQHLLWIVLLLCVWQVVHLSGVVSPLLLPGLGEVAAEFARAIAGGELPSQVGLSLLLILAGLAVAVALALVLGFASLYSRVFASFADTLCMLAHPLPAIALLPLIIVWFGVGPPAIIAIIAHSAAWPLLLNLTTGFAEVPRVYLETARSLGLRRGAMLVRIYLPASVPYLLAGCKTAWARAWRALISAEMLFGAVAASGGIGWYIFKSRVMMNTPGLFAGILVVICIGVVVDSLLRTVEARTIRRWSAV
ncbi:ABC transporter permease subunit [Ruminococcaceae bacterium OttesenSCG-928-O06]|nr:ABC transporter permease subunit [Ruminococcaceae bacterium OttesenSCG-928-O06]